MPSWSHRVTDNSALLELFGLPLLTGFGFLEVAEDWLAEAATFAGVELLEHCAQPARPPHATTHSRLAISR